MSTCEKCWTDAYARYWLRGGSQAEHYRELLRERASAPCSPEQQAGVDAALCPACDRRAVHQRTRECMACGWRAMPDHQDAREEE